MVNNIRDLAQDKAAGKRTLAVLVGLRAARALFAVLVVVPYLILVFFVLFYTKAPLVYFTLLAAVPAIIITLTGKTAPEFILALKLTSLTALLFGLSLAAAIAF
jgi:1,4-dihydroxy-2-naphthoate octaprenyltransferase